MKLRINLENLLDDFFHSEYGCTVAWQPTEKLISTDSTLYIDLEVEDDYDFEGPYSNVKALIDELSFDE